MAAKVKRCGRCDRRVRGAATGWGVALDIDEDKLCTPAEILCPACQTDHETTTRENNDRGHDYVWVDSQRLSMWPKSLSN